MISTCPTNSMPIPMFQEECNSSTRLSTRISKTASTKQGWRFAHRISPRLGMATRSLFRRDTSPATIRRHLFRLMCRRKSPDIGEGVGDDQLGRPSQENCHAAERLLKFPPYLTYAPLL